MAACPHILVDACSRERWCSISSAEVEFHKCSHRENKYTWRVASPWHYLGINIASPWHVKSEEYSQKKKREFSLQAATSIRLSRLTSTDDARVSHLFGFLQDIILR